MSAENNTATPVVHRVEISAAGKWVSVPAIKIHGDNVVITGKWLKIAALDSQEYLQKEPSDPEYYLSQLKSGGSGLPSVDVFTFAQRIPATLPKYDFPVEFDSVAVVCTKSFKKWWESLPQEGRKNVRRSQKRGVVVRVAQLDDDLIRGIMGVNNDSPTRQKKRFLHYRKSFEQVKYDQTTFSGCSDFISAYLGEEMIGFLKIAYSGDVASIVQLLSKASHHAERPANAMLAKAVELLETKKVSYLTYGRFNYGNKEHSSLREFKIRNGFTEMRIPRFYVPLTAWGKLCVTMRVHRGLLGFLPRSVIAIGIRVRTQWYAVKQSRRAGVAQDRAAES